MLTTGDLARLFGVHPGTVRRWADSDVIKAYRIGPRGERRYRREDTAGLLLARAAEKYRPA
ncbi:MAG: helix-turn-helix domain-containing protein [Dehalococcoidales bacterium]|nr:helix-turn-helix domain-containing protein [Dehalococcoidales bacterium]